jgi:raffinose/stachyose/melibiose transport system permease protein
MTMQTTGVTATETAIPKQRGAKATGHAALPRGERLDRVYLLMLLPGLVLFTLFITLPALVGIFFSFTNYAGFGTWKFVGLTNYLAMFDDPRILSSYGFTLQFAFVTTILANAAAFALAIGLHNKIKWKAPLRTIFFIPMVVSGIVIAYVFNFLFSTSLPAIAGSLGFTPLQDSILANPNWAWVAIVLVSTWQSVPGAMIIYLAGLLAISPEVYEAASIDGASAWRKFTNVTFPLMLGYVIINTILSFKNYLNVYDIIVGLTNGGPGTETFSVAMTIFTGFTSGDYAYQMANAVIFFIVTVVFSLVQLRFISGREVSL